VCSHHPNGHTSAPASELSGGLAPRLDAAYDERPPWRSAPSLCPSARSPAAGAPSSAFGWWSHSGLLQETFAKQTKRQEKLRPPQQHLLNFLVYFCTMTVN